MSLSNDDTSKARIEIDSDGRLNMWNKDGERTIKDGVPVRKISNRPRSYEDDEKGNLRWIWILIGVIVLLAIFALALGWKERS